MATRDHDDAAPRFGRLKDLDDYQVADGYPDIRGWEVKTSDGRTIGKVEDLVVDTGEMRTRYVDVELDRSLGELARDATTPGDQERHTLLPIGSVQLSEGTDDVLVNGYTLEQIAAMPRYAGGDVTTDYERSVRSHRTAPGGMGAVATGAAAAAALDDRDRDRDYARDYEHTDYDDQRLFASRRPRGLTTDANDAEQRLTLAEEQLAVGKRQVSGGEVTLQKTVETEQVREQVALSRDEVSVERRPLTGDARTTGDVEIGEDEIRIPVMEERVVTQKVLVPREEIIVRKRRVTEQQTVEGEVRRERVDVEGDRQLVRDAADRRDR